MQSQGYQVSLSGLSHWKTLGEFHWLNTEGICANVRLLSVRGLWKTEKLSGVLHLSCCRMPHSFAKQVLVITRYYLPIYTSLHLNKTLKRKDLRQEICFVQAPSKFNRTPIWVTLGTEMRDEQLQEATATLSPHTHTHIPYPREKALINLLIKWKLFALNHHTHSSLSLLPSKCVVLQLSL